MLAWLKAVGYLDLWVAFVLLTLLSLWVGNRATPQLENQEKLSFKRPLSAFAMAGDADEARKVLNESKQADADALTKIKTALGWDFLFLFIYPLCFAVGCLLTVKFLAAHELAGVRLGVVLLALQPLGAVIDLTENYALLKMLRGQIESPWLQIANLFTIFKWVIPGLTLLYLLAGGVMRVVTWVKG